VLLSANAKGVHFLGYGTYLGDEPCPSLDGFVNPKLQLDDGTIAWGCETWWGPEEVVKNKIEGRPIIKYKIIRDEDGRYVDSQEVQGL
jgi:hypothetical protein